MQQDFSTRSRNWRDLIRPKMLEQENVTENYGKFTCEPLERGYGITLGNSLRRVLLSSLQGAAITSVRISNAVHEFASIDGVVEDVTDIILNIKGLRLGMKDETPRVLVLDVNKSKVGDDGKVLGKHLETPEGVEVLDPEHHIATLSPSRDALISRLPSNSVRCWTVYSSTESVMKMISMSIASSFSHEGDLRSDSLSSPEM